MLWSFYKRSNLRKIRDEGYDSNINTGAMKKKMKNPNIAEITKHYVNKWVALSEDHTKVLDKLPRKVCIVFEDKKDQIFSRANLNTAKDIAISEKCFVASKSGSRWSVRPLVGA